MLLCVLSFLLVLGLEVMRSCKHAARVHRLSIMIKPPMALGDRERRKSRARSSFSGTDVQVALADPSQEHQPQPDEVTDGAGLSAPEDTVESRLSVSDARSWASRPRRNVQGKKGLMKTHRTSNPLHRMYPGAEIATLGVFRSSRAADAVKKTVSMSQGQSHRAAD